MNEGSKEGRKKGRKEERKEWVNVQMTKGRKKGMLNYCASTFNYQHVKSMIKEKEKEREYSPLFPMKKQRNGLPGPWACLSQGPS